MGNRCRLRTAICQFNSKWCGYPDYVRTTLPLFRLHRGRGRKRIITLETSGRGELYYQLHTATRNKCRYKMKGRDLQQDSAAAPTANHQNTQSENTYTKYTARDARVTRYMKRWRSLPLILYLHLFRVAVWSW